MTMPTLLDIAKANGSDAVVGLIDETTKSTPEVRGQTANGITLPNVGAARTISGISYKTLVRIALPSVAFRGANEGVDAGTGRYENRTVETYILDQRWECDKAVADRYEDGAAAYIAMEAEAIMEAAFQHLAKCFYYGTDGTFGDAKGFPGLLQAYDAANMVVDAGGTTNNVASSVWAVKFGPRDVRWVYGNDGALEVGDVRTETLTDAAGKKFTGYVQNLLAYPGLQVASLRSVARIKKLTTDSGKGLTDDLVASLLNKFPAGVVPDVLLMTRRSLEQLRTSRTATNATGAPAPVPTEAFGIPIAATDSISNTETLTL